MVTGDGGMFPEGVKYYGLQNHSEASWCHSVVQALYFCIPFREHLMEYYEENKEKVADGKEEVADGKENLLLALAGLFNQISSQEKQAGVIDTESLVQIVMTPGNGFVKKHNRGDESSCNGSSGRLKVDEELSVFSSESLQLEQQFLK